MREKHACRPWRWYRPHSLSAESTCGTAGSARAWGRTGRPAPARSHGRWRVSWSEALGVYWREITTAVAVLDVVSVVVVIPWVLAIKREAISAVAWCLLVLLVPLFGALMFVMFGYQYVHR